MKLFKRKGQSATEYLMTYGWALLAIAVVGGLLYMYVFSNQPCNPAIGGFDATGVKPVENEYQVYTDGSISFILKNYGNENVTIKKIVIDGNTCDLTGGNEITLTPGQTATLSTTGTVCTTGTLKAQPKNKDACESIEMSIVYDVTGGLTNKISSGTLVAKYVEPV